MATYTKRALSGSTNGKAIKITGTTSGTTTIHTAVTGTTDWDEIWAYAQNTSATAVDLTIEYGGTTSPDNLIIMSIPAKSGLYLMTPGLILQNGLVVTAFAGTANVLTITGFVNRIAA